MTERPGWPAVSGAATFDDIRRAAIGDFARNTAGALRAGLLPHTNDPVITGKASMAVDVAAANFVIDRGGAVRIANDGVRSLTISPAPLSGSRWSVIYIRQREASKGDGADGPIIDKVEATASLAAARALLPAGALEIGHVQVSPGVVTTNAATGVVITQTVPYTAGAGGVVWLRNQTEQDAWTPADGNIAYRIDLTRVMWRRGGAWQTSLDDTGWQPLTLNTGWSAQAPDVIEYRVADGLNSLSGRLDATAGAGTTVTVLPVGARPTRQVIVHVQDTSGTAVGFVVAVNPDGTIVVFKGGNAVNDLPLSAIPPFRVR